MSREAHDHSLPVERLASVRPGFWRPLDLVSSVWMRVFAGPLGPGQPAEAIETKSPCQPSFSTPRDVRSNVIWTHVRAGAGRRANRPSLPTSRRNGRDHRIPQTLT